MWGPTASCPACSKRLVPHCPAAGCAWGRCAECGVVWNRMGRGAPADELPGLPR